jgi:hypothetical protein
VDCHFTPYQPILGVFMNLQKATVIFMMSACMGQLGCHWTDFYEI